MERVRPMPSSNCAPWKTTGALDDRRGERVVQRGVGRGLRPLVLGQAGNPLGEQLALLVRGGLLGEEEVLEAAGEHLRRPAGRLDVDHLVLLGDRRRRQVQQRGEGPEEEIHLLLADQRVVVGDDRVLVGRVVLHDELDVAAQQAAAVVHHLLPDLVALLGCLPGLGELAGQRERRADRDRAVGTATTTGVVTTTSSQAERQHPRQSQGAQAPAA